MSGEAEVTEGAEVVAETGVVAEAGGGDDGGEAVGVGFDEDVAADALAGEPGQVRQPAPVRGGWGVVPPGQHCSSG